MNTIDINTDEMKESFYIMCVGVCVRAPYPSQNNKTILFANREKM